jgi:hypothetical protein
MAFVVPQFPIMCNVFTADLVSLPPRLTCPCNLAWGRRVAHPSIETDQISTASTFSPNMTLLVPALTDLRDSINAGGQDGVEVPAGSGRFYFVVYVDDIGKGFANEHRAAIIVKRGAPGTNVWPTPIP